MYPVCSNDKHVVGALTEVRVNSNRLWKTELIYLKVMFINRYKFNVFAFLCI